MINRIFNLRDLGIGFSAGASLITYISWAQKTKEYEVRKFIFETNEIAKELQNKLNSYSLTLEQRWEAERCLIEIKNNLKFYKSTLDNFKDSIMPFPENSPVTDELKKNHDSFTKIQNSMEDNLQKALDILNYEKNNFLDNLDQLINNYKEFLSNLDVDQLCQLLTITSSSLILICLINIIIIYFANYIIDYLNLEKKFPKLSKFLKIRKMFQKFNISLNLLLIFISLFLIIYVNYFTLFK